jgi:hypothetical protein
MLGGDDFMRWWKVEHSHTKLESALQLDGAACILSSIIYDGKFLLGM